MKINIKKTIAIVGALFALFTPTQILATTNWTGNISNDWHESGNWSNGAPVYGNDPYITLGIVDMTSTVDISTTLTLQNAILNIKNAYFRNSTTLLFGGSDVTTSIFLDNAQAHTPLEVHNGHLGLDNNSTFTATILTISDSSISIDNSSKLNTSYVYASENLSVIISRNSEFLNTSKTDNWIFSGTLSLAAGGTFMGTDSNLTFDNNVSILFDLTNLSEYNETKISAQTITLKDNVTLIISNFSEESPFASGDSFDLFDGTIVGTFASIQLNKLTEGLFWDLTDLYITGTIRVGGTVIPEPSTYALIFGILALALAIYRKRFF